MGERASGLREGDRLAQELHLLGGQCEAWLKAWGELPARLQQVMVFLQAAEASADAELRYRAREVREVIAPLQRKQAASGLDHGDLVAFAPELIRLVSIEKAVPDHRKAGSLYSELHGRLENLVNFLAYGLRAVDGRTGVCLALQQGAGGQALPIHDHTLKRLQRAARKQDIEALAQSSDELNRALAEVPVPKVRTVAPPDEAYRHWIIVAVEDDPVWQAVIQGVAKILKHNLEPHWTVECEVVGDRKTGEQRLKQLATRPAATAGGRSMLRPLAILDMGIPRQLGKKESPSRDEGLALLRVVRGPTMNVPSVVLTTAPNFLGDHLAAADLGISDYLLKDAESQDQLLAALTQIITRPPRRQLRVLADTGRQVLIDDVNVSLEPMVFRTVSVLADAAPEALTPGEVVNRLEARYTGYQNLSDPTAGTSAQELSIRNYWRQATEQSSDALSALAWLRSECFPLWKILRAELEKARIPPTDSTRIAAYLQKRYPASVAAKEFDPANIEKHVHLARKSIRDVFNAATRHICPEEEVIVNAQVDGEFAYKVVARVAREEEDPAVPAPQFRILVAENDLQGWRDPIELLLTRFGYEVRAACCQQEAIETAREFKPHLLCLDMHMPFDHAAFHRDPMGGEPEAGLRVLAAVSDFLPEIRSVIMTDLVERDCIREAAGRFGVRVRDFIAKRSRSEDPWEAELILKIHRLEQEVRRQSTLPLPNLPTLPFIHLWRSDPGRVEIFDRPWKPTTAQKRLVWVLAERACSPVPTETVLQEVYDQIEGKQEALKQLVKNLRKRIPGDWFGIGDQVECKRVADAVLTNDAKAGWILNARVVIEP